MSSAYEFTCTWNVDRCLGIGLSNVLTELLKMYC